MQGMKSWMIIIIILSLTTTSFGQSDYLRFGDKQYDLIDKLDIKLRNDSVLSFSTTKPFNRKYITQRIQYIDSLDKAGALPFTLSEIDRWNMQRLLMDNQEWAPAYYDSFKLKKPVLHAFYKNPGTMLAVNIPDFKLQVNPLLNLQIGRTNDGTGSIFVNTRGLELHGNIDNRVGFYTYLTENQERDPLYVRQYTAKHYGLPGEGYYKNYKTNGYDYFDARGGITFNAGKYFDFVFAYDKLFIGDGYRSLMLSDASSPFLFLKINTRIWKFNYENVFAQMVGSFKPTGDFLRPQKYMAMHHLSFQAFKWLNVGLYENVMFGRSNGFELGYLNPIIFLRSMEQQEGSPDKASVGLNFKSNAFKNVQFYGQLAITEFVLKEVVKGGSWRNKQAWQLGMKYVDAFGLKNLNVQAELNSIRPYMYTHNDSVGDFTHYNQPLAHPLGANLRELVLLANYQPLKKLYLQGRIITYLQGLDSANKNYGSNIFLDYGTRSTSDGVYIGNGIPVHSFTAGLNASYEIFENMFLDLSGTYRTYNIKDQPKSNVFFYTVGFRVNMQRRQFNF